MGAVRASETSEHSCTTQLKNWWTTSVSAWKLMCVTVLVQLYLLDNWYESLNEGRG